MIIEFLLIPCLFAVFAGWGAWAKILTGIKTDSFSLTVILGLSIFSIPACLFLFFTPLTFFIESVLLIFSIIPFLFKTLRAYSTKFPKELLQSVWFWIFCLIIILAGSYYPFRPDHFYYYTPTINWLNQYGLIIGVANIDWALGQMSVFHIMQAGLDQTIDPFQRFCVFITILFLVYIFERKAYLLLFVIPVCFLFIQAASPDVAIVFLSLIVINELYFNYKTGNYKILFLISIFAFIIKPVAFWLPLLTFITVFFIDKKELKDYRAYLIPTLLITIFLIKNVIASSTLFYPVPLTKLNTYWLPDLRILELSNEKAAMYTFDKYFTIDEINSMTFLQKIYNWLSIGRLQTIINCIIVMVIAAFGVFSFLKKNFLYQLLWIIIVIKSLIVFSFSGQFRFIIDGIFPLLFIMFYPVITGKTKIFITGLTFSLLFLFMISNPSLLKRSIPDLKLTFWMKKGFTKKSILIPECYSIKRYAKENLGNLDLYISYYFFDYDTPPPAFKFKELKLYHELGIFPQMKDPANIRKGYYMKMLTPEEKEKLGKMIEMYFPDNRTSNVSVEPVKWEK